MPPDPLIDEDEQYASSEDSDFRPDDGKAAARESADSDSESDSDSGIEAQAEAETETKSPVPTKRRREDLGKDGEDDAGFDNSGDEAIIEKAQKRQKKKQKKQGKDDEDLEDGGEGGVVKTRSMRAAEKIERKQTAAFGPVTIDVDSLWEQMKTGKASTAPGADSTNGPDAEPADSGTGPEDTDTPKQTTAPLQPPADDPAAAAADSDMILIKRKYNFAGKIHTEEKLVPRNSAEAKLYLESVAASPPSDDAAAPSRPAPRRAFRSAFEPVLEPLQRRGDLNLGLAARLQARDAAGAKKLTTVEKSRMDWAGFVDREGIKDELVSAGKSKESYAEREGFLARSEARREEDARRARISAMVPRGIVRGGKKARRYP
ncbi:related to SWR1-complex protein 5 [Cephalotrichum gorgonifer]|uniref:SWR1-complex protein 5 n=1 Tax=Cephalotrichum gorgonifer TaxID=2041049 RepID=A0AAE8STG9_9PEZI|nr:related to SWR1-complex protein 5 [Cephalotrichum gorgonifer]